MKRDDLCGQIFGLLVVIKLADDSDHVSVIRKRRNGKRVWKCFCLCQKASTTYVTTADLKSGKVKSCGCLRVLAAANASPSKDLTGNRFGRLTAISRTTVVYKNNKRYSAWICLCECGSRTTVTSRHLINGSTESCGCLWTEAVTTHGMSHSPEYRTWQAMHKRCNNKDVDSEHYKLYGRHKITVCDKWSSFETFYQDVGPRPTAHHSLDRWPDPYGNYEPENTRWATPREQNLNRRHRAYLPLRELVEFLDKQIDQRILTNPAMIRARIALGTGVTR